MIATLLCSTGLVQWNGSKYQPYNETRSGEFLLINMTGQLTSDRLICSYAIRFNGGDEVHEVPHQENRDGTNNYKSTEPKLGTKCSHGCIRVQRLKTPEGINMAWIYNLVNSENLCGKVKVVIWEDWQGRQLPEPDPITIGKITAPTARESHLRPFPFHSWMRNLTANWNPVRTACPKGV